MDMPHTKAFSTAARWVVLGITVACVLMIGLKQPHQDWDMIAYVASAYQLDGYRGRDLLERTYRDVRSDVSDEQFETLIEGHRPAPLYERAYRKTVSSDPKSLSEQIPFYSIRIVYVELLRRVGRLVESYSKSSYILSATFSALSVVVLSRILSFANVHFVALPFVVMAGGIAELARISSADSLAFFISILCVLAFLNRSAMSFVLAVILPAMRTDYILVSLLILLVEFIRGRRIAAIVSAALAMVLYIAINKHSGNYGWVTLIKQSLAPMPYPADPSAPLHWKDYLRPYITATYNLLTSGQFIIYFVALYFGYSLFRAGRRLPQASAVTRYVLVLCKRDPKTAALLIVPLLFLAGHLLLFPFYDPRFFVFSAVLVLVWILSNGRIKALPLWKGSLDAASRQGVAASAPHLPDPIGVHGSRSSRAAKPG
jgi:hypothetical protein